MSGSDSDTIAVTMTLQEWHVCRAGLLELPGKHGLPVLMKLEQQLAPHLPRPNGDARPQPQAAAK